MDQSDWVVCAAAWLLERSRSSSIGKPFALLSQHERQCQPLSALGAEVQRLVRIDPAFALAALLALTQRGACEEDAFLLPAQVQSLLALARAPPVLVKHVGFRPDSALRASSHSQLNSCRDANDRRLEGLGERLSEWPLRIRMNDLGSRFLP
jgi:hypothetical protein